MSVGDVYHEIKIFLSRKGRAIQRESEGGRQEVIIRLTIIWRYMWSDESNVILIEAPRRTHVPERGDKYI